MKTLHSIVTNLKSYSNLFWPAITHDRVGYTVIRCTSARFAHHTCAREFFNGSESFYCECHICINNNNIHYFVRGENYYMVCSSCAAENHPRQP